MEFKQDDSCSVQKSSCFLEIPFLKLSLTKGTLYYKIIFLYYKNFNNRFNIYKKFASLERRVGETLHFANDISLLTLRIHPLLKNIIFYFYKVIDIAHIHRLSIIFFMI